MPEEYSTDFFPIDYANYRDGKWETITISTSLNEWRRRTNLLGRRFRELEIKFGEGIINISNLQLAQRTGLSVIGRSLTTLGPVTDISATLDGQVLRRSGNSLGFGQIATAGIADNAVTTAKIANSAVTNIKLADNAVTSGKIADNSVTSAKIESGAVTTGKIADGAVTAAKIVNGAVTAAKIPNGEISTIKIADSSVTTAKIAANAVTAAKIADNAVIAAKIADNAVTSGKIADNAVITAKIADNAVITAKIANNAVIAAKIADNAVTSGKIADNAVITAKIANNAVITAKIANGAVTNAKVSSSIDDRILGSKINPSAGFGDSDVRVGLVRAAGTFDNGPVLGSKLYFSGGRTVRPGSNSENSDPLWMARANVDSDRSELRMNIGDNPEFSSAFTDSFVVGATKNDEWTERFRVTSGGRVGINTDNPQSALEVNGQISFASLNLLGSGGPRTPNFNNGNICQITRDLSSTIEAPSNRRVGTYIFIIRRGAGATLSWNSIYRFPNGQAPQLSTSSTFPTDVVSCVSDGVNMWCTHSGPF
jgi:hypothetical protein